MIRVGLGLFFLGAGAAVGYLAYFVVTELYPDPTFPIVLKVSLPIIVVGLSLVLFVTIRDRVRAKRHEAWTKEEVKP